MTMWWVLSLCKPEWVEEDGWVKVDRLCHSGVLKTGLEEKYFWSLLLGVNVVNVVNCDNLE